MTDLEKIDVLRERLGLNYREAKELLERAGGDVVEALALGEDILEEKQVSSSLFAWAGGLVNRIRQIIHRGNVTKIKVKKEGKTVAEIPATVGALGVLGILASSELAVLAGLSTVAALFHNYTLEIERPHGKTEEHPLELDEGLQ